MARVIIGGDICPTIYDMDQFAEGDTSMVCKEVKQLLEEGDLNIANLETPLIEKETPISKSGAVFGSSPKMLNLVEKLGINFLNLSNNHILDHGEVGLNYTMESLSQRGLAFSGAGKNLEEASEPFKIVTDGKKVAILSYAEHEFSIAGRNSAGANPLNIIDFVNRIQKLRDDNYFVILLYHGGKEHYKLPTPSQQEVCRFFIEQGVSIVTCQHSHTGGAYENYREGMIFYGQGNYIFDPQPLKKEWLYKGFLIDVTIEEGNKFSASLFPIIHRSFLGEKNGIRKMTKKEEEEYMEEIHRLNEQMIKNSNFVQEEWDKLCDSLTPTYLSILNGNGRLLRKLNEKTGLLNYIYRGSRKQIVKNIISCETHREILSTILKK